ncbi:hypothetical protein [Shewanella fidelis]|uniref:Uncharacterized protein n=1 Tax=Shewanella fidelis TaxID=173509 RepID=A0AAW8NPP1_9GAMM|nr:hypothetical protein [Shewanella fidelis]MDR8523854.1 hypothetical protein [Shewanella fidelis]MDW4810402.1 hypothetical protein [Shewanella fidelis]MDW4823711.1 hypothetical protein [Shewanella fidelis]
MSDSRILELEYFLKQAKALAEVQFNRANEMKENFAAMEAGFDAELLELNEELAKTLKALDDVQLENIKLSSKLRAYERGV